MASPGISLLKQLRTELKRVADARKAPQMQAYMKSEMPYLGVQTPVSRPIFRRLLNPVEFRSASEWRTTVREIWDDALFREERYGALFLCKTKNSRPFQNPAALPLYRYLVVSGAWWDYVDDIAVHSIAPIVQAYPDVMKPKMLAWSRDKNIWIRRSAILSQLFAKDATDLKLLYACIEPSLGSEEFFLNKAIGWALRQLAWTQPKTVLAYVKKNEGRLHPLSVREATKNLKKSLNKENS